MRRSAIPSIALALAALAALSGCAMSGRKPVDRAPTLQSLEGRAVVVDDDPGIASSPERAIAAYRDFLKAAPKDRQATEAMRRLGDLEMDRVDGALVGGVAADYRGAIAQYRAFLAAHPDDPGNDRVLYQLARAYELSGDLNSALGTLDRLVQRFAQTPYADEAQFRRGELLFTMGNYVGAEKAFALVLDRTQPTPYHERSLYMRGWAQFKQSRLEEALQSFFGVLDRKLAGVDGAGEQAAALTRADRELVDDTLRVVSLSLQNLQGAESIAQFTGGVRRGYEVRVYEALGEMYVRQERIKDAADTFAAFARRNPLHAQAPVLQARVIDIYQHHGFATLALQAKREYVDRYGAGSELKRNNPEVWQRAQPLVRTHLAALAQHHHAAAQKARKVEDYQQAVRWYRQYLEAFAADPQAAEKNFLLAELLFEDKRYGEAAAEYEKTAYGYPPHARSADAGYAALLAYGAQETRGEVSGVAVPRAGVDSALRFADAFASDPRVGPVLASAAESLYKAGDADRAGETAQRVLKLEPPVADGLRRTALLVIAHIAFDRGAFDHAESGYRAVLALAGPGDKGRADLGERIAASIYKQGEAARDENRLRDAVGHFERVAAAAPNSKVGVAARIDAAAALIALKDWDRAAALLVEFRDRQPGHPLAKEAGEKLAAIYLEQGRWAQAGAEMERIAAAHSDAQRSRQMLWQAAELHEKGGASAAAVRAFERYLKLYPQPALPALEARYRLALLARNSGDGRRELALMKQVQQADLAAGSARSDRSRYLGAMATLALAGPVREAFSKVALVEPLQRQLKLKKARLDEVLKAYTRVADYGVAEAATAATYQTAELYAEFGRALLASQRPKGLKKQELEQYNVLLEEQAFPFEEKAIELHEANARRAAAGVYDSWVRSSYVALAKLRPVRFGKNELTEGVIDAIR
jgi:outer membrane protein assembly factor BamD (BamD/ComL family)